MRKTLKILPLFFLTVFGLVNCGGPNNDIVILYTNDVHCAYDTNIGYDGVAALKKEAQAQSKYVTLVDSGDFTQGSALGTLTSGSCLVRLMNDAKYDLAILGNHEFDYGMDTLIRNIDMANFKVICSNMEYKGTKSTSMLDHILPYKIIEYGNTKIGYIGVTTPLSYTMSVPKTFDEDEHRVYFFKGEESGAALASQVQITVNEVRNQKVNYVVLLSHLGIVDENDKDYEFSSCYLANHTKGIDAILDGHSHTVMERLNIKNTEGKDVPISQTGTGFNNVGKLTIKNGNFDFKLINKYDKKDSFVTGEMAIVKEVLDILLDIKISHTDFDLTTLDEEGVRLVRTRETNLGDLVADAFREVASATVTTDNVDIAFVNAGAVRGDKDKKPPISRGDITYKHALNVSPYGNLLCVMKIKGEYILDMLEYFVMNVKTKPKEDGKPIGESGSFPQVSGLKYTIDARITSPAVEIDQNFDHIEEGKPRRIDLASVKVLENGEWHDFDKNKIYKVASTDYIIKNGGCGMGKFLTDERRTVVQQQDVLADYEALINFFNNKLSKGVPNTYRKPQGRITVVGE